MQITDELLDKLAQLTKLDFEGEEKAAYKADFQRILDFVDHLQSLDTTNVQPLIHVNEETNHLRNDEAETPLSREQILQNAPLQDGKYFYVPRVVKK